MMYTGHRDACYAGAVTLSWPRSRLRWRLLELEDIDSARWQIIPFEPDTLRGDRSWQVN